MSSARLANRRTNIIILAALIAFSLLWLLPFVAVLSTSLRSQGDLFNNGIFTWPKTLKWGNFVKAWVAGDFSIYFKNSLFVILVKVPLGIFLAALAAYPLAKIKFRFSQGIFLFFLIGLAVPVQVASLLGVKAQLPRALAVIKRRHCQHGSIRGREDAGDFDVGKRAQIVLVAAERPFPD